jgi:tetratricopeptide (TPR) repeat protein
VKWLVAVFLLLTPAAPAEDRFQRFDRDLKQAARELGISDLRAAVIDSGRMVWHAGGPILAKAPLEPVVAERIARTSLDTPAPAPPGATIRQVLENRADGTPGEVILENREFFEQLRTSGTMPNAIAFAKKEHGTLGWFLQDYAGERIAWSYEPALLIAKVPNRKLTLIASADSKALNEAARLQDGNIARSLIALAFLKDVVGLAGTERDELIDRAFLSPNTARVEQALDKFPEIEILPDVTLLYLFSQLRLSAAESSATAVIREHPSLPTAWFYYAQYLESHKRFREAVACFEQITLHQPPWHHWTVAAAQKELGFLKTY